MTGEYILRARSAHYRDTDNGMEFSNKKLMVRINELWKGHKDRALQATPSEEPGDCEAGKWRLQEHVRHPTQGCEEGVESVGQ